jgi:divalent metal cation (Fe/Co/Zn/Cd) transporter
MPDAAALAALYAASNFGGSYTSNYNSTGVAGMVFGSAPNIVFLPHTSNRNQNTSNLTVGTDALYWGNTPDGITSSAIILGLITGQGSDLKAAGHSCRCVKE